MIFTKMTDHQQINNLRVAYNSAGWQSYHDIDTIVSLVELAIQDQ